MHSGDELPVVVETAALREVLVEMTAKRLGMTAVVDAAGALAGIVTDGDIRRALARTGDVQALVARDLMTRGPRTIVPSALGAQAWAIMEQHRITSLLVVAEGSRTPAGVVHLHDILRAGVV
jgi:arabinose-5-phosphate isomerase